MVAAPLSDSLLGSLSSYENYDVTTHIGTCFSAESPQIADLLSAPDSDELIRDLAHLVSQRGVVFFTNQQLTLTQQKELGTRLGDGVIP